LGLGANIGDRLWHIEEAVRTLGLTLGDIRMAPVYVTAPRDYLDQDDFLNTVIKADTDLPPLELLSLLHAVEAEGGRVRTYSGAERIKGPRTIDIDILLYGELCRTFTDIDGDLLTIPHKSMNERLFVLKPLLDLDPELIDPRDGRLWAEKASQIGEQQVKLYQQ